MRWLLPAATIIAPVVYPLLVISPYNISLNRPMENEPP
nr:J535 [uncultured bacterium]